MKITKTDLHRWMAFVIISTGLIYSACVNDETIDNTPRIPDIVFQTQVQDTWASGNTFVTRSLSDEKVRYLPLKDSTGAIRMYLKEERKKMPIQSESITRGTKWTANTLTGNIGLYHYRYTGDWSASNGAAPNWYNNAPLSYNSTKGYWNAATTHNWTGDGSTYRFYAYYPYQASFTNSEAGEGIVNIMPTRADRRLNPNTTINDPSLRYIVPQNIASQIDVMVSPPPYSNGSYNGNANVYVDNVTSGEVFLTFGHIFASVNFKFNGVVDHDGTVTKMELKNIFDRGNYSFITGRWQVDERSTTQEYIKTFTINYTPGLDADKDVELNSGNMTLLMMPQTVDAGELRLTYSDDTHLECALAGTTWEAGQEYTYSLVGYVKPAEYLEPGEDDEEKYYTFQAPADGRYLLEVWGARGGFVNYTGTSYTAAGGFGGYSRGVVELRAGELLYVYVGGAGGSSTGTAGGAAGYNGGGKGGDGQEGYYGGGGGGGATHISRRTGLLRTYTNATDIENNLLVVAGGGGGGTYGDGGDGQRGSAGGGEFGLPGFSNQGKKKADGIENYGGEATDGYARGYGENGKTTTTHGTGGAGGGLWGGGTSSAVGNSAGGGSGYILGVEKGESTPAEMRVRDDGSYNGYAKISSMTGNSFSYTGEVVEYKVKKSGTYQLECWGGKGGFSIGAEGGDGGYASCVVDLIEDDILYVCVGGKGATERGGGYNGGGKAGNSGSSGGGASHIATRTGLLYQLENYKENVILVAGGAGGGDIGRGGDGGGEVGGTGNLCSSTWNHAAGSPTGGTQTEAGANFSGTANNPTGKKADGTYADVVSISGGFGRGGYAFSDVASQYNSSLAIIDAPIGEYGWGDPSIFDWGGAGGGGWYGGGHTNACGGGGGGSGYVYSESIGGFTFPDAAMNNRHKLVNGKIVTRERQNIRGDQEIPSPAGGTEPHGHNGAGTIRITYIAETVTVD